MLVIDVGPILSEPSDPRRLGDTGEVLVGVRDHDLTRYLIPPRLIPRDVEIPASRTPAMSRAVAGERGFMRTHDRLGHEVLAALAGGQGRFVTARRRLSLVVAILGVVLMVVIIARFYYLRN